MDWLNYSDDEVKRFHTLFESSANQALIDENLENSLDWDHHNRTPGNKLVPDFVLRDKKSGRWILSLEIKRSKTSLYSTRNQVQAKSYAEVNSDLYLSGKPRYFAISNLENTLLFALKNGAPPNECRLIDGIYQVGDFADLNEEVFRTNLTSVIRAIILRVLDDDPPEYDTVWPRILADLIQQAELVRGTNPIQEPESPNWDVVRNYFCDSLDVDTARIFLLRCLLAEYIYGVLERYSHPRIKDLLALTIKNPRQIGHTIANTLSRVRGIDFQKIFEESSLEEYLSLSSTNICKYLASYVGNIITPPTVIRELARNRLDRNQLIDGLVTSFHSEQDLDNKGKVVTDPELAALLASVAIKSVQQRIVDPCCGDGILLEAAYERLRQLGLETAEVLQNLIGLEVDPILARLAFLRLILKEPSSVNPDIELNVEQADLFSNERELQQADVVLMNPPFRRYEAQDQQPVPTELRSYYANRIQRVSGLDSIAISGQQNFFTYYVEFILHAVKEGCRLAIILDNKWYHNKYAQPLRKLLLENCEIETIIEYPYQNLFSSFTISTSIIVCTKTKHISGANIVRFNRCSLDLAQINLQEFADHYPDNLEQLTGWSSREIYQNQLDYKDGWKNYFSNNLILDFRDGLPTLESLFRYSRRGSLAKEEGGMGPLAFPFSLTSFGHTREADPNANRRYQNRRVRRLTARENRQLHLLASAISEDFHGYAIKNPNILDAFMLDPNQLLVQATLEPPTLRAKDLFWTDRKTDWTPLHNLALQEIKGNESTRNFVEEFRRTTQLDETLMPDEWLFVGLKEPYAGELIIPRKMRNAHRVHINPFPCIGNSRQVRVSSNFISFTHCQAIEPDAGLDRLTATRIVAAFLLSSFGQLQFEMKGYNREGLLSIELHHLKDIKVLEPRSLSEVQRSRVLNALDQLTYPIPMNVLSNALIQRNHLDEIFAEIICSFKAGWSKSDLLAEVHQLLDEYLIARNP